MLSSPATARTALISAALIATLALASCAAGPAGPAADTGAEAPHAIAATPAPSSSPSPTAAAATWPLPASWTTDIPPLTGLTVLWTSVAIGVDGMLREVTFVVEGVHDAEVDGWIATLPDVPATTHADYSTITGDTEIRLSSGSPVSQTAGDLPAGWRETLPLGPADMVYAFAGVEYEVLTDGSTPNPPSINLTLDSRNRVTAYRAWLEAQPSWTVTFADDNWFNAENADFAVSGMTSTDGTDELTITPLRWDLPGLDALRP
ncbi:hypothetical protein AB0N73_05910 [Microbacterium sp. NPDC089189]|uniref:hypothetical protein n=1 Tax=Microbacterium sp. NPDC089189 TaxID=3154972 RepID=UPI00344988FC